MADFKMSYAVLVFAVIGIYNVRVIHLAESDIETKVGNLEYLFNRVLKHDIEDIKDTVRNIQNGKPDHACCKTEEQPAFNQTSGDGIQRLVNEVTTKTRAMITAFSMEKSQLRSQRTYLTEALGVIRESVEDHENQTRDLVDHMKDNHQVHFEQLINKIEFVQHLVETQLLNNTELALDVIRVTIDDHKNHSRDLVDHLKDEHQVDFERLMNKIEFGRQQSQQKYDSVQQLVEKLSADIDSMKSNIDGMNRKTNSIKAAMPCKEGWKRQLDSCVLYVDTERKTWFDAQAYCNKHGGFLVEPYSLVAVTLLIEGVKEGLRLRWWIGASDRVQEGVWRWESTGRKIGIQPKWLGGEPNNEGGSENCAELRYTTNGINDSNCLSKGLHFICEIKL